MKAIEYYGALAQAIKILDAAQLAVWQQESTSPAWRMVLNARDHIQKQAEEVLRNVGTEDAFEGDANMLDQEQSLVMHSPRETTLTMQPA